MQGILAQNWNKKISGTIQVVIGPVINTNGFKRDEINKRAEQWINALSGFLSSIK